jgi:tetratricopeptide (TPR) repeat protein
MRRTRSILAAAVTAAVLAAGAAPPTDEAARTAEEEGRWPDAVAAWKALAAGGERRPTAEVLRVLEAVGAWDDLESRARSAAAAHPGWDAPWIALARSLSARGREGEALGALEGVASPTLALLAERGFLRHGNAEREEAARIMQDVVARYGRVARPTPRQRFAAARAHRYLGNFEESSRLYQVAYRDSADYLEARLELATLFHEKYQANLAGEELHDAQNLYPDHPDVHLVTAWISLQGNRLAQAEEEARRTLDVRPGDPGARIILSRLALISEQPAAAREWVAPVLEANPRHLGARSALAAAEYMSGDTAAYEAEVGRVLAQDPGCLEVFLDLAGLLDSSRRNDEAFALYDRVLARDPANAFALIESGLLHMREGREKTARGLLERGFEGDPFNIRAYNQLELLDLMDTFASYPTEHFEIRLDAGADSLFVPLLKESLEAIYRDLVPRHGWAPETRTIIEVLPSHDWFSARVTGLPWIGGIPAVCFGDVVAMDSPRTLAGKSNWREILKHEFGHVLALGMTQRRVPFWFTEGLSVYLEDYPRDATWDANLAGFYLDGGLIPVDSLTIAFTRPRSHAQRLLAYHEAGLIIEDLVARKGWDVVPRMLEAFGRGRDLDAALRDAAGTTLQDFSANALRVVRAAAAAVPVWPAPDRQRIARLSAQAAEGEDTPRFLELLALTQFQFLALEDAAKTANKLLELDPDNARAHGILGLLLHTRKTEPAGEQLERAIALGSTDIPVYQALAQVRMTERDTTAALGLCERILEIYPGTVPAAMMRARLLAATGDPAGARAQYRDLLTRNNTAPSAARELARMDLAVEDAEGALAAVTYAEGIVGPEAELEALRGRAYLLLGRDAEAYEQFLYARRLDIKSVETMVGMALYYLKRSDRDEAAYFAQLALRYDPEHAVAKDVLAQIRAD